MAGLLCLAGLARAEDPRTKFAWLGTRIELAITIEEGNDHEFRFVLLESGGFPTVYSGIARGPAGGTLVFQESEPADGRKAVRIEFRLDGAKVAVRATPVNAPNGAVPDLSGSYGIVTRQTRLAQAQGAHQAADRRLNEIYQTLRAGVGADEVTRLRSGQQQWIAHRDQMAGWHATADGVGEQPAASVDYWRWMSSLTRERSDFLALWNGKAAAPGLDGAYRDGFGGWLTITAGGPQGFHFSLSVVRGPTAHTGEIEGTAKRHGDRATFTDADLPADQRGDPPCVMDFNIIGNRVEVTGKNSGNYHGARAYFDGTYYKTAATPVKEAAVPESHTPAPPRAAPDDPADAITIALDHLDHIDIVLQGYRGLTERLRKNHTLAESVLQKHAGTDRETQNLGFRNWPAALRGTLLAQQDELADLRLRLAETGNAPSERIEELRTKAAAARAALETFRKNQPPPAD